MKIHKEGYVIILVTTLICGGIFIVNHFLLRDIQILYWLINLFLLVMYYLVVQFFRVPHRNAPQGENIIICPADGKVVVIEETEETEYFKDKRIQISIFMSPMNVHANWNPIHGITQYVKYHPGKYLVAWHPKSSIENERTTVVVKHANGSEVLFRQIAGAVARRIVCYAKENEKVTAGTEFGFIKFGSRIDVFVPLGTPLNIKIGDVVQGKTTIIGQLP
ncbi:MAG: phosphatidylserine decarboxylase family protein [Crocinitomicaceae bacterium]|nr:phosphatidylserine decarboxylase family protein [Crocinitomicaceae bacterium]MBK8925226.1 phosphatidylserine decarboxylase family protein [Crocinitomicaceae bacterium]